MEDDENEGRIDAVMGYQQGDDEFIAEVWNAPDPKAVGVSSRKTPWFEWNKGEMPGSPLMADMASGWVGAREIDIEMERARGRDRGWQMEQDGYVPAGDEIFNLAEEYGLSEAYYSTLAKARSPDDLKALATAEADRMLRQRRTAESATGVEGFLAQTAVAMLDPAFLVASGGVGSFIKVGMAPTRLGNVMRGGAANLVADVPLESYKALTDPAVTWEEAGLNIALSASLGAAFGSLSKGGRARDVEDLDKAAAGVAEKAREARLAENARAPGSSVGAAQAKAIMVEVERAETKIDEAPERGGFGRFGTPIMRLSKSLDDNVRLMASKLGWDTRSSKAQGITVTEAQRRVFEAGTVFVRRGREAAKAYYQQNKQVGRGPLNPMAQPNTKQIRDFNKLVAQVHAGVRTSDNPHVQAAVAAYREGYEDSLQYLKNSSYNGPGSESLAGLTMDEWADIASDPNYVMRRFSKPGWQNTLASVGPERLKEKFSSAVQRGNADWLGERARKAVEDEWIASGKTLPGQQVSAPKATPAPAAPVAGEAGVKAPAPPPTATVKGYTDDELFGGKPPKTGLKEADQWYAAQRSGSDGVAKFIDTLTDTGNYSKAERTKIIKAIFEADGIEDVIPQSAENVRRRLAKIAKETRRAADATRAKAEPPATDRIALMKEAQAKLKAAKEGKAVDQPTVKAGEPLDGEFEKAITAKMNSLSDRIARKYIDTVAALLNDARSQVDVHAPIDAESRAAAKEVARKVFNGGEDFADDAEEAIELILDMIAPIKRTTKESARAKSRLRLDLTSDNDGDILDIFDWDAEALFTTYRRQTSGHAGFLKAGYTSTRQFTSQIEAMRNRVDYASEQDKLVASREADLLQGMVDATLGKPPKGWALEGSQEWIYWTTQVRRMNFSSLMGNTGFLSLSEVGGALTKMGPMRLIRSIPEYAGFIKKMRKGDPEATESAFYMADALMGHGSSQVRSRLMGFSDRGDGQWSPEVDRKSAPMRDAINTFTRKSANATARWSGMAPLTEWLRVSIAGADAQDWVKAARGGVMPYKERRMTALGIDKPTWARISTQLKQMTDVTSPDTNAPRPFLDFTKWDDGDAANVFLNAIDRNSRRLVLEGDVGHKSFNLNRPSMSLLFQFLNFPINAWTKHTGFAMTTRDSRAVAETIAMSLGGALGFTARAGATALLLKEAGEERDKYLAENLTPAEIAKAAFYYSAHASLVPNMMDMPLSLAQNAGFEGVQPLFSKTRASGLAADPLMGNATRSHFYSMLKSAGGMLDGPSEQDFEAFTRSWLPVGNHIGVQTFVNAIAEFLPEDSD